MHGKLRRMQQCPLVNVACGSGKLGLRATRRPIRACGLTAAPPADYYSPPGHYESLPPILLALQSPLNANSALAACLLRLRPIIALITRSSPSTALTVHQLFSPGAAMSNVLQEVLAANQGYAADFGAKAKLAMPPARRFAILTCMDARLDPAKFAGLAEAMRTSFVTQAAAPVTMPFVR